MGEKLINPKYNVYRKYRQVNLINPYWFLPPPNTFIGGVSATINTPALIAAKLGISVSRIKNFSIVGSDIKFAVVGGTYTIPLNAFLSNTSITYFNDQNGLVGNIDQAAFKSCSSLIYCIFPKATNFIGGSTTGSFQSCAMLQYVTAPRLTTLGASTFTGCSSLQIAVYPLLVTIGFRAFSACTSLLSVNFPICTTIQYTVFDGCTGLKYVYLDICTSFSATSLGTGQVFRNNSSLEILYIPKCIQMGNVGNESNLLSIKTGCVITANVGAQTINAGGVEGDIQYAITSRSAIVNYVP